MTKEEENKIIRDRERWFQKNFRWLEREIKRNIVKPTGPMVQFGDDLIQIVVEQFLKKPLESQKQMLDDNTVSNYLLVTAVRHLQSSTSPFYNQIRKERMKSRSGALPEMSTEDENEWLENQDWYLCFKREMEKMNFYYRQLLIDKYQEGMSYEDMHKKYNITKTSLNNDVHAAMQLIRCRCNNDCR